MTNTKDTVSKRFKNSNDIIDQFKNKDTLEPKNDNK
jgi:hypothetical protein